MKVNMGDLSLHNHFYENNIKSLKARAFESATLPDTFSNKISVMDTASGLPTLRFENILLHSSYDPEKEARRFAEKLPSGACVCIYGFGLGYHLTAILDKIGPQGHLLVIELNPDILTAALQLRDQTKIFAHDHFHLIYGTDEAEVSRKISSQMSVLTHAHQLEVLFHTPSFKCIPTAFPALTNALEVLLLERRFPAIFGDLEEENYSRNKQAVANAPGINVLKNSGKGRPGVLVSAGPSLDLTLPYLHRLQKDFLIACVDTSFPILINNDIQPDFVFSLDPQIDSVEHFIGCPAGNTKLIFTPTANPQVLTSFSGERYVVFKGGHRLSQGNEAVVTEKGITQAGGSVACLGLDMLIHFGCDPIFMLGQDCAFAGNRYYSSYSKFNDQLQNKIQKGTPLKNLHQEKTRDKKQMQVKGTQENFLLTDQVMYSYLRTLEQIIEAHPETRVFNLNSHGAEIEHAPTLGSINELKHLACNPT
jgi:hypothetical protein